MLRQDRRELLDKIVRKAFAHSVHLSPIRDDEWEFSVPYGDQRGDPLLFSIRCQDDMVAMDDGGAIAGLLFSMDQDVEGTPAFDLLASLAERHKLLLDYDEGFVKRVCRLDEVAEVLPMFTRVVLTVLTASPHVGSKSSSRRSYSSRNKLRQLVLSSYREWKLDSYVFRGGQIRGKSQDNQWKTDFHYPKSNGYGIRQSVYVVTTDLENGNPLSKAHKVSSLALDTRNARAHDDLRIVIHTGIADKKATFRAASLIREHEATLNYNVFDFTHESDRMQFMEIAQEELVHNGWNRRER